ncbi:MAG: hypothetical protein D5R97_05370 [Candidatus Syntrophonatronum acetioxidans]|uniref:Uncharacterized protein n=1 Tax=Candidatus Syntrophonatronum acetioxidans TaxID=1795816 RepID=A0A424YEF2_9FIRM|nr:MAG: hypothetical protein D5R97_05370 [Candidatus Syntrophonatronum acetioxidans]
MLEKACSLISEEYETFLPFKLRSITIEGRIIKAALEILNSHLHGTMPQNSRNDIRKRTTDGLDLRLKEALATDLRMANIISDVLARAQISEIGRVENPATGRMVKGTRLKENWCWSKAPENELQSLVSSKKVRKRKGGSYKAHRVVIFEDKNNYLHSTPVREFIHWLEPLLDKDNLRHLPPQQKGAKIK